MQTKYLYALLLLAAMPSAYAKTCKVDLEANDQMKFNLPEIKVAPTCTQVTVTLKNVGKFPANVMGHNFVLTKTEDYKAVATDGTKAGLAGNFVPAADPRILTHVKVLAGGETASTTFSTAKLKKGGDYTFFCSFPGHWTMMVGKFIFA